MYRECINCPKLGVSCDGEEQLIMPRAEILEWIRLRKLEWIQSRKDIDFEILIDDEKYSDRSASIE